MATLTSNITSTAGQITVSGDVSGARTTQEYRIDDEVVVLRKFVRELFGVPNPWGQLNRNKWIVSRGMAGTTAASHLAGAEIVGTEDAVTTGTTLAPPEPFAGEGGSSEQTITLLGPLHVAHDTPEISGDGVAIVSGLPIGTTILAAQVIPTETWDNFTDQVSTFDVGLNGGSVPDGNYQAAFWTKTEAHLNATTVSVFGGTTQTEIMEFRKDCRLDEEGMVIVWVHNGGGLRTTGEADVYVLIASPSA